jgi:hypothetical protein
MTVMNRPEPTPPEPTPGTNPPLELALARLRRFAGMSSNRDIEADQRNARLVRHATLSAYRDVCALGMESTAKQILAEANFSIGN